MKERRARPTGPGGGASSPPSGCSYRYREEDRDHRRRILLNQGSYCRLWRAACAAPCLGMSRGAIQMRYTFHFPSPAPLPIHHTSSSSSLEQSDKVHTPKETLAPFPSPTPTPFPSDVGNEAAALLVPPLSWGLEECTCIMPVPSTR